MSAFVRYGLRIAGSCLLLTLIGSAVFTLTLLLNAGLFHASWPGLIQFLRLCLIVFVILIFFGLFNLWPVVLFLGIWTAGLSNKGILPALLGTALALLSGIYVSWVFQAIRPFDFYHEGDGSKPGWERVSLASSTTFVCCFGIAITLTLTSLALRRFRLQKSNDP